VHLQLVTLQRTVHPPGEVGGAEREQLQFGLGVGIRVVRGAGRDGPEDGDGVPGELDDVAAQILQVA
jgi:hypothetical protein